ncbi:flagellar hook-associated protein FlgK [Bradyrhizobium sp. WD16]|uniref:flagellar hook-associated protein FlgK n=1 Tax=Bradyrhizobium sp. WD16 TaxID=1521768 RepID=UPI0020A60D9D|nr:flagellar hook-associated protein FlgK [Bradyrhizobium sp. WD16]UTD28454.1 flagellar hook-associated protein FlgK [Bradyrhizobium sp. WD16]
MSLSSALSISITGLSANQAAMSIVSSNISNAQTPGYVARSLNQTEQFASDSGSSVRVLGVIRELDSFVQSQLRTEKAGGAYADQISNILSQLQGVYGTPGNAGTLENAFNNFTAAVQALSANSGNQTVRSAAVTAAQSLAQQLNATTNGIQALRSNADQDISASVAEANASISLISKLNSQLQGMDKTTNQAATLMDQRDAAIGALSKLMDIRVSVGDTNQATIYTSTGMQLVGPDATSQLIFNSAGPLNATSLYNVNSAQSGVGSLLIRLSNGSIMDVVANNGITSGRIAADLKLRDATLVQAQAQVDQLASTLASSLSDKTTAGTAVSSGAQNGFKLDLSGLQTGNTINLNYTDAATNTPHQITLVRVDDPSVLPLPNTASNPNDKVIGIGFFGGMASVLSQLNGAFASAGLQFSNPSGSVLQVLDNGGGAAKINSASVTATMSSLTSGNPQLPLFTDGNSLYTGAVSSLGSQQTGFAGRIAVNQALLADPSKITVYSLSPPTTAGDTTRSDFLYSQLTTGNFTYSPQTGLGSTKSPFKGTISNYLQQFIGMQGNAAANAKQVAQGQDIVVNTLQEKFNASSSVNIDSEMANLIALQNNYAANARVMSVVQSMMQTLLQAQR